jgi:hypothetical protein
VESKSDEFRNSKLQNSWFQKSLGGVMRTQEGGKSEIRSCDIIFIDISGNRFSAFPLTRRITLHIRRTKIAKCEEVLGSIFWHFGISGSGISRRHKFGIVSFELPIHEILKEESHFGILEIQGPEGIRGNEFEDKPYELPVCQIMLTIGSRGRATAVDLLGSNNTSVLLFQDLSYGESC